MSKPLPTGEIDNCNNNNDRIKKKTTNLFQLTKDAADKVSKARKMVDDIVKENRVKWGQQEIKITSTVV